MTEDSIEYWNKQNENLTGFSNQEQTKLSKRN